MLLKYMTLKHWEGTVIKVHYSHKTTTTRTTVLQQVTKQ